MYSILRNPYFEDGLETPTWNVYNNGKYLLVNISGSIRFSSVQYSVYLLYFCLKPLDTEIQGPNLFEKRFDRNGFS